MEELAVSAARLSPSSPAVLSALYVAQAVCQSVPQIEAETDHVLHAGMYARTVRLPTGAIGVGTLIKIPTLLIVHGDLDMWDGEATLEIRGYGVFQGCAGRKSFFVTRSAVEMTMIFPTAARTVDEAEREFTDEYKDLMTRKGSLCRE